MCVNSGKNDMSKRSKPCVRTLRVVELISRQQRFVRRLGAVGYQTKDKEVVTKRSYSEFTLVCRSPTGDPDRRKGIVSRGPSVGPVTQVVTKQGKIPPSSQVRLTQRVPSVCRGWYEGLKRERRDCSVRGTCTVAPLVELSNQSSPIQNRCFRGDRRNWTGRTVTL